MPALGDALMSSSATHTTPASDTMTPPATLPCALLKAIVSDPDARSVSSAPAPSAVATAKVIDRGTRQNRCGWMRLLEIVSLRGLVVDTTRPRRPQIPVAKSLTISGRPSDTASEVELEFTSSPPPPPAKDSISCRVGARQEERSWMVLPMDATSSALDSENSDCASNATSGVGEEAVPVQHLMPF